MWTLLLLTRSLFISALPKAAFCTAKLCPSRLGPLVGGFPVKQKRHPLSPTHTFQIYIYFIYICFNPSQLHLVKFKSFPCFSISIWETVKQPCIGARKVLQETFQNSSTYLKSVAFCLRTLKLFFQELYIMLQGIVLKWNKHM